MPVYLLRILDSDPVVVRRVLKALAKQHEKGLSTVIGVVVQTSQQRVAIFARYYSVELKRVEHARNVVILG